MSQKLDIAKIPFPKVVLQPLKGLSHTTVGATIYKHLEIMLERNEANHAEMEEAYSQLLDILLKAFISRTTKGSSLQAQLNLIMLHLSPPLSKPELITLKNCFEACYEQMEMTPAHTSMEESIEPISANHPAHHDEKLTPGTTQQKQDVLITQSPITHEPTFQERRRIPRNESVSNNAVDSAYKRHLHEKKKTIVEIQQNLAQQLNDTKHRNEEFGMLLNGELHTLQEANSQKEIDLSRKTLIIEVKKLLTAHHEMSNQFNNARQYLDRIAMDSQELNDELDRVHLLSLTDELTELPNRRAFMRRLEDEIGRVQRYGNDLPLVLIDLDGFKSINDQYGHTAGDKVLRLYSENILSIFRHHDMVARYGGEEFAVLLPNTDAEGALSAVRKVQRQVAKHATEHNGVMIPTPTFSAGIAHYQLGETPTEIIERADTALYRAKHLGRNRIEVASKDEPRTAKHKEGAAFF
ncbi:MAG: diguanylate cyclase [Gammaproteobacteria bacterium]|nr:diguanylate cyclase [Gammaproteobacteria bacterium]